MKLLFVHLKIFGKFQRKEIVPDGFSGKHHFLQGNSYLSGRLIYSDVITDPHAQTLALKLGRHKGVKLERWPQPSALLVFKLDLNKEIALFLTIFGCHARLLVTAAKRVTGKEIT